MWKWTLQWTVINSANDSEIFNGKRWGMGRKQPQYTYDLVELLRHAAAKVAIRINWATLRICLYVCECVCVWLCQSEGVGVGVTHIDLEKRLGTLTSGGASACWFFQSRQQKHLCKKQQIYDNTLGQCPRLVAHRRLNALPNVNQTK